MTRGDHRSGGDAPSGGSSGSDSRPPPQRPDISGGGDGLGWGAGDFSLPPFSAVGSSGDAGIGHQGGSVPAEPPPTVSDPYDPPDMPDLRRPYVGPDAGFGDGRVVGGDSGVDVKAETGHGGGHQARWAADRPSLDPPPANRSSSRLPNAAREGEQHDRNRKP